MGKTWVEVCLISARGLRRSSSFWKLQWFAVGWIDPNSKYCSKVDASGNPNPVWKTKFAIMVDDSKMNLQDLALQIEVYCREPLFLREKLHGSATVILKEYLARQDRNSEVSRQDKEEAGSYQLRKRNSSKPKGFVDVSIRVSGEEEEPNSYPDNEGGFMLMPRSNNVTIAPNHQQENQYQRDVQYSQNHSTPYVVGPSYPSATAPSYQPPVNVGYLPTFRPRNDYLTPSYINMPSSVTDPARRPPTFGVGVGAGALAAGAAFFGEDYMSGFDSLSGQRDPTLAISMDPPF